MGNGIKRSGSRVEKLRLMKRNTNVGEDEEDEKFEDEEAEEGGESLDWLVEKAEPRLIKLSSLALYQIASRIDEKTCEPFRLLL